MEQLKNFIAVIGYEDKYLVNELGQVYSIRYKKFLKPLKSKTNRYYYYSLMDKMKRKNILVHRLVALHFIPNKYNKPFVNHINGSREDNSANNLEWCTHQENVNHAWETGLNTNEQRKVPKKLTQIQVDKIRKLSLDNIKGVVLAKMFNISPSMVGNIINNKQWI